jgi:hypothetical protein
MMFIKNIIKRSPIYGVIKWFRVKKEAVLWTAHDRNRHFKRHLVNR